jgi:hypothetical protein
MGLHPISQRLVPLNKVLSQDHFLSVLRRSLNRLDIYENRLCQSAWFGHFNPMSALARQLQSRNASGGIISLESESRTADRSSP